MSDRRAPLTAIEAINSPSAPIALVPRTRITQAEAATPERIPPQSEYQVGCSITMPASLMDRLNATAKSKNLSRNAIVREALTAYFNQ